MRRRVPRPRSSPDSRWGDDDRRPGAAAALRTAWMIGPTSPCPCGYGGVFGQCCLPLHRGERSAATAEQLMRSRYSAYAVGDTDYIWRTWHPRTRPAEIAPVIDEWVELEILEVVGGRPVDEWGEVEFRAHHRAGVLRERSRFRFRARRWFYLDGEISSGER